MPFIRRRRYATTGKGRRRTTLKRRRTTRKGLGFKRRFRKKTWSQSWSKMRQRPSMIRYKMLGHQLPGVMKVILPRQHNINVITFNPITETPYRAFSLCDPSDIMADSKGTTAIGYGYYKQRYRFVTCVGSKITWDWARSDGNAGASWMALIARTDKNRINKNAYIECYNPHSRQYHFRSPGNVGVSIDHWRGSWYMSYKKLTGRSPHALAVSISTEEKTGSIVGNKYHTNVTPYSDRPLWRFVFGQPTNVALGSNCAYSGRVTQHFYCVFSEPYGSIEDTVVAGECGDDPDVGVSPTYTPTGDFDEFPCPEEDGIPLFGSQGPIGPQGYQGPL